MELFAILLQAATDLTIFAKASASLFAALAAAGAGFSIGKIGVSAIESIARQPEVAGDVRSNMIVSAALIEGLAFFAIVVCLLVVFS